MRRIFTLANLCERVLDEFANFKRDQTWMKGGEEAMEMMTTEKMKEDMEDEGEDNIEEWKVQIAEASSSDVQMILASCTYIESKHMQPMLHRKE